MLKQTRRNRFLHIDGWQYQGLRSRLARHGPIGGIALRPSSFEVEMSLVISLSRKLMCKFCGGRWSGVGLVRKWIFCLLLARKGTDLFTLTMARERVYRSGLPGPAFYITQFKIGMRRGMFSDKKKSSGSDIQFHL